MTVHMISVGLSVLEFVKDPWAKLEQDHPDLAGAIEATRPGRILDDAVGPDNEAASRWLAERFSPPSQPDEHLLELTGKVQPGLWPGRVSAELDTFARAGGGPVRSGRLLDRGDIAVLLATDTAGGLAAALWNAAALTGGDLDRVAYLADPLARPADPRGRAVIVRVPDLDASNEAGFRKAMKELGGLGLHLIGDDYHEPIAEPDEPFRFYLSGGFKAAIPYLIGLAEALRSRGRHDVDAFVLHETDKEGPPIPLPLRRVTQEQVKSELKGFDGKSWRQALPKTNVLQGYAYDEDEDGGGWKLTAFGEGLRMLFGLSPEVVGG